MILTSGTISYLGSNIALFALSSVAFIGVLKILKSWNFDSTTNLQYSNEKQSFLISTIINFLLIVKIILSFYLLYLIDSLVPFIKAAMCGVGVINATNFGWELLTLKIVLLILFGLWIGTDKTDMKSSNYTYLKFKFKFFILIYILMIVELFLDLNTVIGLDTQKVVSCCSITFSNTNQVGSLFSLSPQSVGLVLAIVFSLYLISGITALFKEKATIFFGAISIVLIYVGLLALIYTFSPYVYELPTHTCPFCLIQKEYHYIGYFFYISLIFGCFFGIKSGFSYLFLNTRNKKDILISITMISIFILLGLYYVLGYFLKNGVWL